MVVIMVYKPTYNWGAPSCSLIMIRFHQFHPGFAFNTEAWGPACLPFRDRHCITAMIGCLLVCAELKFAGDKKDTWHWLSDHDQFKYNTYIIECISGWWYQTCSIFHFIYGMSSFPITNSIIFQDGFLTPNQIIDPLFMVKLVKPPFFTGK